MGLRFSGNKGFGLLGLRAEGRHGPSGLGSGGEYLQETVDG